MKGTGEMMAATKYKAMLGHAAPHAIMFHHIHDGDKSWQGSISKQKLNEIIEFLGGRKGILDAKEWYGRFRQNSLEDGDICISFDDSLKCQYKYAKPALDAFGIKAFFFVYSSIFAEDNFNRLEIYCRFRNEFFPDMEQFYGMFFSRIMTGRMKNKFIAGRQNMPEDYLSRYAFYSKNDRLFRFLRDEVLTESEYMFVMDSIISEHTTVSALSKDIWMSKDDVGSLSREGHMIGLHSFSHPFRMAKLKLTDQKIEYRTNYQDIIDITGEYPVSVSHPANSYSKTTLDILRKLGIQLGFCDNMSLIKHSELEYPREDHAIIMRSMASHVRVSP